jgi:hypothetical protein
VAFAAPRRLGKYLITPPVTAHYLSKHAISARNDR